MLNTASKTLIQRMREFREKAGLSQRDMGRLLGINQATYSAMERGKNTIGHTYLPKFAEIFKVQIWEFFANPKEIGLPEEEDKEFFEAWKRLTKADKDLLKQMCRALIMCIDREAVRHPDLRMAETIPNIDVSEEAS